MWRIKSPRQAGSPTAADKAGRSDFIEAAGFQWINPKAWAMAGAITAQFIDPLETLKTSLIIAAVFVVTGLFSASAWTFLRQWLAQFLKSPEWQALFNKVMGALVAAVFSDWCLSDSVARAWKTRLSRAALDYLFTKFTKGVF